MVKNREELAAYLAGEGKRVGVEVGVLEGDHAVMLCRNNPDLKLYGVDVWDSKRHMQAYKKAIRETSPHDVVLLKEDSLAAVRRFENNSLDFVYIDADHRFDWVMRDIIEWYKKVKKGGILAGHDYRDNEIVRVKIAVDVYVEQHNLKLQVTTDESEELSWWFPKKWRS